MPQSKPKVNLEVYVQIEQSVSANVFDYPLISGRLETRWVNCVLFWSGLYEWERHLPARAAKASRAASTSELRQTCPRRASFDWITMPVDRRAESLKLSAILSPLGVSIIEGAYNTQPIHHLSDTVSRLYRLHGPILAINNDAMPAWKAAFTAGSATLNKPVCPVFVCMDTFDGGTVVPVEWQEAYVAAVTALGATITTKSYPKDDHFSLPTSCIADARK